MMFRCHVPGQALVFKQLSDDEVQLHMSERRKKRTGWRTPHVAHSQAKAFLLKSFQCGVLIKAHETCGFSAAKQFHALQPPHLQHMGLSQRVSLASLPHSACETTQASRGIRGGGSEVGRDGRTEVMQKVLTPATHEGRVMSHQF